MVALSVKRTHKRTGISSKMTSHLSTAAVKTSVTKACIGRAETCICVQVRGQHETCGALCCCYLTHAAHARFVNASANVFGSVRLA